MSDKDTIIWLVKQLAQAQKIGEYWQNEYSELKKNSIPVSKVPQTIDEGVSTLEKLGEPQCQIGTI